MQVQALGQEDPLKEGMETRSCLENPMGRGDWWATVQGAESDRGISGQGGW